MTQPMSYGGRPMTPAPGAPTPELGVARFRAHARRLSWSALVLIAVAGAVGYFYGNLPAPFENWMLLAAASVIVLFLVLLPFLAWWSHVYTITTRRVIERTGSSSPDAASSRTCGVTRSRCGGASCSGCARRNARALQRRRRATAARERADDRPRARGPRRPGRGQPDPRAPRRPAAPPSRHPARPAAALTPVAVLPRDRARATRRGRRRCGRAVSRDRACATAEGVGVVGARFHETKREGHKRGRGFGMMGP